jgi:ribonuclease R
LTHRAIKAALVGEQYLPEHAKTEVSAPKALDLSQRAARTKQAQAAIHERWVQLGLVCSANERRADDACRDVEAWLKCFYMRERIGEQYSGTVSGVTTFGLFITLDSLFVEGLVHVSDLGTEYYQFNEALHELRGERTGLRYRLGDKLHVQVSRVDIEARKIDFRLVRGETYNDLMRSAKVPEPPEPKQRATKKRTAEKVAASKRGAIHKKGRRR